MRLRRHGDVHGGSHREVDISVIPAGTRIGALVVVRGTGQRYLVRCDCGHELVRKGRDLKQAAREGWLASCGCRANNRSHGLSRHPLYSTWLGMLQRCQNPAHKDYGNYGGRGIKVCDRWADRETGCEAFMADMGVKPTPAHSLDRVDNDGPYTPENTRWATRSEQNANKRPRRVKVRTRA
jgi:hypothetical protein